MKENANDLTERVSGNSDSLSIYMREMSEANLLSREEETGLAQEIKQGSETARERMIKANLRLVIKIAGRYQGLGVAIEDLISEGNIGLMTAVDAFDPGRGAKLSTFAAIWIKQRILQYLSNQSRTIRLPDHFRSKVALVRKVELQLEQLLGRRPSLDELSAELEFSGEQIEKIKTAAIPVVSLDSPRGDDSDGKPLEEFVPAENIDSPGDRSDCEASLSFLHRMLGELDSRHASILRMRFGLDGNNPRTLEDIGAVFGVTRERIRQQEAKALLMLRKRSENWEGDPSSIRTAERAPVISVAA